MCLFGVKEIKRKESFNPKIKNNFLQISQQMAGPQPYATGFAYD
jgi:hypothetical protein